MASPHPHKESACSWVKPVPREPGKDSSAVDQRMCLNAVSAFANCRRVVAFVRGSDAPTAAIGHA